MTTFIRSALVALALVTGVSAAMAAPQKTGEATRAEQTDRFPEGFWEKLHVGM